MNGHQVLELIRDLQKRVSELETVIGNIRENIQKPETAEIKAENGTRARGRPRINRE